MWSVYVIHSHIQYLGNEFSPTMVGHCVNYRLGQAVNETVKCIKEISVKDVHG